MTNRLIWEVLYLEDRLYLLLQNMFKYAEDKNLLSVF